MNDTPTEPTGIHSYTTTFDLSGYDVASAFLSGRWTVDDGGTLLLNNHLLGTLGGGDWSTFHSFTVDGASGFFVSGVNTLEVALNQADGYYDALNVDQLVVRATALPTTTTPEPTSVVLLATGLAGVVGAARRRRNRPAA